MTRLFDSPIISNLRTIIDEIKQGSMLIPDFHRPFVWRDEQRLNLLDSVAKGYPIGSLLLWKTSLHKIKTVQKIGQTTIKPKENNIENSYILDGHQRLATLFSALTPPEKQTDHDISIQYIPPTENGVQWMIAIELEGDDYNFIIPTENHINKPNIYPSWILLSNQLIFMAQQKLLKNNMTKESKKIEQLSNQFKDYLIPITPIINDDLDAVLQAFMRVNVNNTPMNELHLTFALTHKENPYLEKKINSINETFSNQNWTLIDQDAILSSLKIRFNINIYKKTKHQQLIEKIKTEDMKKTIEETEQSFTLTTQLFKEWKIYGGAALIYRYQVVLLAELIRLNQLQPLNAAQADLARRWFHQTSLLETFTGATSSRIRDALQDLQNTLSHQKSPLDGNRVRLNDYHRWGSVRTNTRLFIQALHSEPHDHGQALIDLSLLGNAAIHKLSPELSTTDPASYIICSPEAHIALRRWLQQPDLYDHAPPTTAQIHPDALHALKGGDLDAFSRHQRQHLRDLEATFIRDNGLIPEPDEGDA